MITIADRWEFPETQEEAAEWTPQVSYHALAMCVLCVATTRIERGWAAYCDRVPGMDHSREWERVLKNGRKLKEEVARVIFPEFSSLRYFT